jgi:23S rRNA (adenine2503-C2)-methyltransferase
MRPLIYDLDKPALAEKIQEWGFPSFRVDQIWRGLYQSLWTDPGQFNVPPELRAHLAESFSFSQLDEAIVVKSNDRHTTKTLFRLPAEGELQTDAIEAVLMAYDKRRTLCISTQVGCAMGCVFCATGQMGFKKNLSAGQIIEQVLHYARQLRALGEKPTNVVIMGMGEPFHNYEATMAAIDRLNDPTGYNMGARRFTVSTVGLIPMIDRFAEESRQVNLAVSLHAADDALRESMLPINKQYPIADLIQACHRYVAKTGRRITFEWALIHEVNDSPEQAAALAKRLRGLNCHVNAIPLNPTTGYQGEPTDRARAGRFQDILEAAGIPCTIRVRRGIDINAGCGQLAVLN